MTDDGLSATISAEDLEADERALGLDVADGAQEFLSTATPEAIRNFAHSYGDDNPLFCDPAHGPSTRWGGQIAPSLMAGILNAPLLGDPPPADRRGGRYRGIHVFASAFSWDCYQPLRPGDTVFGFSRLDAVEERKTAFAGRTIFRTQRWVKMNQRAEVLSIHRMLGAYTERRAARDRGTNVAVEPATYTDAELAAIDAIYASERPRGAEPRCWEDTEVGEALPMMAKGPFTVTDVIRFHAGGYHLNDLRTGRLAWANRQRKPRFYIPNEQGIPDVAQRVHWDPVWAQATGNPTSIDYGSMREFWLHHLLTDWAGDDGWVAAQHVELRKFSYLGDTHFLTGEVTAKREVGDQGQVEVALRATSQRDVVTAVATATVTLPRRGRSGPTNAEPPPDITEAAERMMARHHELSA